MATETDLANLALGHLGNARITDLSEPTVAAEHCRRMWDTCRDALLRQYPWNFASRRVRLPVLSAAPEFEWQRQYQLPSDCLKVLEVNGCPSGVGVTPWQVEGSAILTDFSDCRLKYTRRVEQVSAWDATFQELFGYELAKAIAPSLTLQASSIQMLDQLAAPARARAQEANATETKPRVIGANDRMGGYQAARCGGSRFPFVPSPEVFE